jgi:predicted lipoprotein with Yx(FWY)xxD motif
MSTTKRLSALALALAVTFAVVSCSDDDSSTDTAAGGTSTTDGGGRSSPYDDDTTTTTVDTSEVEEPVTGPVEIGTADTPAGEVLTAPDGKALYIFLEDEGSDTSTCNGECAAKWPSVRAASADDVTVPDTVRADIDVVERDSGTTQVTIGGLPVYTMLEDEPGTARCQGGEGVWWVVGTDGEPIKTLPES